MTFAAPLVVALLTSTATAAWLIVDDDRAQRPDAPYTSIQAAVDAAGPGDVVYVLQGIYDEQIVIGKQLTLRGDRPAVIRPTRLPLSRPSVLAGNPITAAILVESTTADISDVIVDLGASDMSGCTPRLAGIYYRSASGVARQITVHGARVKGAPQCESGVGLYVESGDYGEPVVPSPKGRAVVEILDSHFYDYQKVGVAANGPRTSLRVVRSQSVGDRTSTGAVQYGYQVALGAKARLRDVSTSSHSSLLSGRVAAGVLVFDADRSTQYATAAVSSQTGVFMVGDRNRVAGPNFQALTTAGAVILGRKGKVSGGSMSHPGEAGVLLDGNRNMVHGVEVTGAPVGVCMRGSRNHVRGLITTDVPLPVVEPPQPCSATLQLTAESVAPFSPRCATAGDCDDGDSCTIDACDVNGLCSNTTSADGAACFDRDPCTMGETCQAGVCVGVLPAVDGTSCEDGNLCNGAEACQAGSCAPGTPLQCDDGDACNGAETCNPTMGCRPGNFLFCDDHNVCNGIESCDPVAGCIPGTPLSCVDDGNLCNGIVTCSMAAGCIVFPSPSCNDSQECTVDICSPPTGCAHTDVPDGTPCTGGVCTAGVCG